MNGIYWAMMFHLRSSVSFYFDAKAICYGKITLPIAYVCDLGGALMYSIHLWSNTQNQNVKQTDRYSHI